MCSPCGLSQGFNHKDAASKHHPQVGSYFICFTMTTEKTDDWLIRNAIGCWLHHFPDHQWTSRYEELIKRDTFISKTEVQGRRRPAKRERQTKASTKETTTGSKTQPSK